MLNPSTADEEKLDPTVRRCKSFSEMWGFGHLVVCNLFAYRATEPKDLFQSMAPVGPLNNEYIVYGHWASVLTVAAWGAYGGRSQRSHYVTKILAPLRTLACLGRTAGGEPKHPLYLSHKTKLEPHA
jgi:hypothetical protein